jgi:hypothetical protein
MHANIQIGLGEIRFNYRKENDNEPTHLDHLRNWNLAAPDGLLGTERLEGRRWVRISSSSISSQRRKVGTTGRWISNAALWSSESTRRKSAGTCASSTIRSSR